MVRRIKLLGALAIEEDGRPSRLMDSTRGVALVAYLLYTNEVQSREQVADLLWEASSTRQSLVRLRELLARVRGWLPDVQATRQTIAFHPAGETFVDLFALREGLDAGEAGRLDEALRLYDGDLLAAFHLPDGAYFNEWLAVAREQLRVRVLAAYRHLCRQYAQTAEWEKGTEAARRWVALEALDEEAHRWLMQMLARNGQSTAAAQAYEACRQILAQELEVEPEPATTELAQQLAAWAAEGTAVVLPDLAPLAGLISGEPVGPGPLPANAILPYQRNQDFTGREAVLLQVANLLGQVGADGRCPAVALTGIGGLGKTQTAVEFCYRYGQYFPGGVFWLSFAEAENVAEEVAAVGSERGLGLYLDSEQLSLAEQTGRVQRAWQEPVPRLLVFDNCEDEALLLQWLPKTGGCRVLLTSRYATWPREINIVSLPLSILERSESVALLRQLTSRLGPVEAELIAAEVGDLPLALHLAGNFLERYQQIPAAIYLAQLRDKGLLEHPSLQGRGTRYSPTGHELHVARTFALSLEQLDLHDETDMMARRLLVHAAAFAPGEPIPQDLLRATIASGDDLLAVLLVEDGLARLVTLGFWAAEGPDMVVLHRLLVAFVIEKLATHAALEEARTAVENGLAAYLTPSLEHYRSPGTPPVPIAHLRHVTEMALTRSSVAGASLALALGRHLRQIGDYANAQACLEQGLAVARQADDIYTQGRTLSILARAYFSQGFHQEAQRSAAEAKRLLRQVNRPDSDWLLATLWRQGWSELRLGLAGPARDAAEEAYQLSIRAGNDSAAAESLNLLGSIHYFLLGDYTAADQFFAEALTRYRRTGNRSGEATVLMNQGESANTQGDYHRAVAKVQEALAIIREVGIRMKELSMLINLGEAQVKAGEYETAVANLTAVINQAPKDWTYAPIAYLVLAEGRLGQGQVAQALAAVQTVGTMKQVQDDPYCLGYAWRVLGLIAARLGQSLALEAESEVTYSPAGCFARSLEAFTDVVYQRERAVTLWEWARYELAQGNETAGQAMWQEARDIFTRLNLPILIERMEKSLS